MDADAVSVERERITQRGRTLILLGGLQWPICHLSFVIRMSFRRIRLAN
jgi:hypothetical protein